MAKGSLFSIASLAVNQMIVIDKNGDIKIATIGEKLPEGSVVIQRGDEAGFNNEATTQLVGQNDELQDVTDDVAQLLAALEEGQDPTQLDEELAPAAGGSQGSSPTDSASIDRVGSEIIASTNFSTIGFESLGFSQTQSLALINLNRSNANANVEAADKNSDPKAQNDTISVDEDTSVTIDVLNNDSDKDGDPLTIVSATVPQEQGSVEIVGGKLVFTPAENYNGQANIEYTISDGQGGSDTAKVTVTVNPVNDAPVGEADTAKAVEGTTITVTESVLDNDDDVEGNTLTVVGVNSSSADAVTVPTNGTYTIKTALGGTVVMSSDGTYTYTVGALDHSESETVQDSFSYLVSDGTDNSEWITVTIDVSDTEVAANKDKYTVNEDESVELNLLSNDSLGEDASSITSINGVALVELTGEQTQSIKVDNGTVVITSAGTMTFVPDGNFNGKAVFKYTVEDADGDSSTAKVKVTVNAVNDGPVATDDTATTNEDTAITIDVLANDTDADGDELTITGAVVSEESEVKGTVAIVDGELKFTPAENASGTATIEYTISDGNGGKAIATVTVTVNPVNDAPVGEADTAKAVEGTTITVTESVLDNDDDVEGNTLTVVGVNSSSADAVTVPTNGTYTIKTALGGTVVMSSDGTYTYTVGALDHSESETVQDSFSYLVSDGTDNSEWITVTIDVSDTGVEANKDKYTVNEDESVELNLLSNDSLGEDASSITSINGVALVELTGEQTQSIKVDNGTVVITSAGTMTFVPDGNFNGKAVFKYTVEDADGDSSTAKVKVTVNAVNDGPVATDDTATTNEDTAITIDVLANDTDADGDELTITGAVVSEESEVKGTVAIVDGELKFTPAENASGTATIEYTISDGNGGKAIATVTVTVNPVNDAPVGEADTAKAVEGTTITVTESVLDNDDDVEGNTLTVVGVNSSSADAVTVPTNGTYTIKTALGGTVVMSSDGTYTYTVGALDHSESETVQDSFSYLVSDGTDNSEWITVTIDVSDTGVEANKDKYTVNEDESVELNLLSNDNLGEDASSITSINGVALVELTGEQTQSIKVDNGTVVITSAGTMTFVPDENFNGKAVFKYTVEDADGDSSTAKVKVTVNAVNDGPVATDDTATTNEDTAITIDVLANDTDADGDELTITGAVVSEESEVKGTVAIVDGELKFTPAENASGTATIEYTISDGNGGTATATVTVTVNPVNDAPDAQDDMYVSSLETVLFTESFEGMTTLSPGRWTILSNSEVKDQSAWESTNGLEIQSNGVLADTNASDGSYYAELDPNNNTSIKATIDTTGQDSIRVEFDYNPRQDGNSSSNMSFAVGSILVSLSADGTVSTSDDSVSVTIEGPDADGWYHVNGTFPASSDGNTDLVLSGEGRSDSYGALVDNIVVTGIVNADLTTTEDTVLTISAADLLENDSDPDGDTLTITSVNATSGTHGTVELIDGKVVYTPESNYNGVASFTYTISDGHGGTDTATVTVNVTPENDPPVAEDDGNTVSYDQTTAVGNVLTNDTDVDTPHEDLKVISINYDGVDYSVDESTGATITTPSGTLTIYSDGSYTFEVSAESENDSNTENATGDSLSNITMYGVSTTNQLDVEDFIVNLEGQESNTNSNGSGTGVGEGSESKLSEGESLILDLHGSASSITLSLSEVSTSEIAISVYDSDGNLLKVSQDYTYKLEAHGSKVTAVISSEDGEIGYVVLAVNSSTNGNDFYRVDGVSSVTYIDTDLNFSTGFEEQFTYTVEDGDGGSDTATLTINGEYPVDDAPVITFESGQDSVVVSEEGLSALNANPDSEGTSDTTNATIAQGTFSVSDVDTDSDDLSVSLTAPDVALYSNNVAIEWSTENGNLVGKAGNETILVISLSQDSSNPSSYSYTVTLLGSLDHADKTAEDTLSFDVGIEVSDGTNTVKDSITVTVEDDSPDVPVNIVVDAVEHNETTTVSLGDFNFTQRPNDSGCHNNNAYTFIDTNSGNSVFVYAVGFLGTHHEELTFSNDSGMGVKSSSVFGVINDRTDGEIDYQYGNSEKIVMELGNKVAYGMQVSLAEFYSNEGEKGKIIFLLGGKVVQEEDLIATHSNGNYSASFNVASGFDEVRFEAVTNGNGWCSDNSDYSIKSVSFESLIVDPVIATDEGIISADFGADGAGVITLTGVADTNIKTADGLPVTLGSTDVVDGVKTQVWVDSHGDKVFEIELNSSTGEWSYRQFAELAEGDSVEITYDVVDADGDIVSSIAPNTGTDNDFTSGLKGEFYNVGYQLSTIAQAVYVTEHQNANATFTSSEISYIGQDWDDLGDYDWRNESTNLESWLGDDAQSVEFKNKTDSNDAVVRLTGGVALDAGTYSIKVNADDGYRIIIDGRTVASFDSNTSVRSEEFTFSVDENGIHQIEVIYWDQGGAYVLEVSLNDGSGYELLGSEAYPTYSGYNVEVTDYVDSVDTSNNDHLVGTAANDHIQGLGAQDHLFGGAGDDWLEGGEGDDHLIGGSGKDILDGGSGQDSLSGGSGNDKLYGQQGDDSLSGESGSDYLDGGQGQDYLYGGLGNDILVGGDGDDKLFGGAGNDVLIGGNGHDQLTGGSGIDVFVIEGSNSSDTIMDFNVQEDIVDISELLNIDNSSDHDAIQAYLDSESSSLSITANGDGSATISVADQNNALHSAGSFGADSHIVSGDIVSVLFNNQEYTLKVD